MSESLPYQIALLGLGNLMRTDDAVGMLTLRRLEEFGRLLRFEGEDIDNLPVSKSVHLLGFSDLMCALRLMDAAPAEVVLLGVQPASTDWGTVLTPEVSLAQQTLMQSALAQITGWIIESSALAAPAMECRDIGVFT